MIFTHSYGINSSTSFRLRLCQARYRILRAYYWLRRSAGRPDYLDEINFWAEILRQRPPCFSNRAVREAAFPRELRRLCQELRHDSDRPLQLLEVGSGPVSILAAGVDEGLFNVVAVDPLARVYRELLILNDLRYPIQPVPGSGEILQTQFQSESFDMVYSSNALDHTRSPLRRLEQICEVLRPGGFLLLEGFSCEGSNEGWAGLHQHDIFPEDGHLVHCDRAGRRTVLSAHLPLSPVSERICEFRERDIQTFGYELPANISPDSPSSWLGRQWYTVLFRRDDMTKTT
jgi:SAM-dependent methyltransferase